MNRIAIPTRYIFIYSKYLKDMNARIVIQNIFTNHSKSNLKFNILIVRYNPTREFTIKDTMVAIAAPTIPKEGISNAFNTILMNAEIPTTFIPRSGRPAAVTEPPIAFIIPKITVPRTNIDNGRTEYLKSSLYIVVIISSAKNPTPNPIGNNIRVVYFILLSIIVCSALLFLVPQYSEVAGYVIVAIAF